MAAERSDLRAIRQSLAVLTTLSFFVVAYFARELILPILLGFLIALTLSPVNRFIQRTGLPAAVSAVFLILFAASGIGFVVFFVGGTVSEWSDDAPSLLRQLKYKLSGVSETLEAVQKTSKDIEQIASDTDATVQSVAVKPPSLLNSAVTIATSTATTIAVALILALFLLASGDMFYRKLTQSFPTLSGKKRALSTVYDIERQVSGYLLTITLINAGLGIAVGIAMWMIGLEYAYIWGIAAFLLNYLPVLGGVIGTLLVAAYAIVTFDSLSYALLAPISYQVLTSSEAQFVTPYIVGRRMELNIVAVFLTVVLWGWLWGIAGVIVAVPFLLVFKVVCNNFESLTVIGSFLSSNEDLSPRTE
ncbi:Predicted PurR-regulated permease PerM [Litoreibacter ascidiaceicola]|uniref:Predicted PurR-regulated permease PerM n=1 Tax=Litoreibacter ascidiaceicola TaxID=1486859 RepID=A0A1M5E8K7_9RHOB|nr:AI-2E family transporter [Litoreibacter ascidiaceicola]SHF75559.1 Predicted PurR-regulated permease PerM [Litoreibacter ascidiaceicola]